MIVSAHRERAICAEGRIDFQATHRFCDLLTI
jgi:hypothetical protein